jgi:hypothetical protein
MWSGKNQRGSGRALNNMPRKPKISQDHLQKNVIEPASYRMHVHVLSFGKVICCDSWIVQVQKGTSPVSETWTRCFFSKCSVHVSFMWSVASMPKILTFQKIPLSPSHWLVWYVTNGAKSWRKLVTLVQKLANGMTEANPRPLQLLKLNRIHVVSLVSAWTDYEWSAICSQRLECYSM